MSPSPTQPVPPGDPLQRRLAAAVLRLRAAPPRVLSHLRRLGPWAQGHWDSARRLRLKPPSRKGLAWTAGVVAVLAVAVALFLAWFEWDRMRGPIARLASARIHRTVSIDGHLKVRLLSWTPTVTVGGLRIAQPAWAGPGDMVAVNRATVSIRLWPLLRGRVILPLIDLQQPRFELVRDAQGRANWHFSDGAASAPAKLPPIQQFIINDGRLHYVDAKGRLMVDGAVEARERRAGPYARGFHLDGKGSINGNPFRLLVTGGPMVNIDPNRPYPFNADIRAGQTHVHAGGAITRPFNFGLYTADLTASGPDLSDLYLLTRIALPNTPPYSLRARLSRDGQVYSLTGLGGRVGDSDLAGEIRVDHKGGRAQVRADLASNRLELDDLMAILGGAPSIKRGQTASPGQVVIARRMAGAQRVLPDAPLQIDRLRSMDAVLRYRARTVYSPVIPLRQASLDLKLDHGVLDLDPFRFKLASGEAVGKARIDGRGAVPVTDFDATFSGIAVEQFVKGGASPPVEGVVQARARLRGVGASVHRAAAASNGTITIVMPHGHVRQSLAELMGVNVGRGLYLLLSKDTRETDLRCAVADFKVANGVALADNIVIDTGVVVTRGSGTVNLDSERMDIVLEGHSKKPQLLRLWAPITLSGSIRSPKVGLKTGKAIAQAGAGVALGAALSPLAVLLPFVTPGGAKDVDCAGLIAASAAKGAPVRAAGR